MGTARKWIAAGALLVACAPERGMDVAGPRAPHAALAAAIPEPGGGAPDLIVDAKRLADSWLIYDQDLGKQDGCSLVEGGVAPGVRRVLRFTVTTPNVGTADLHVGDPLAHLAANDGLFEFASCHNHFHFRHYATYELISVATGAPVVLRAAKRGFCMLDVAPWQSAGGVGPRKYDACGTMFEPGNQGISAGYADSYDKHIGGQYFVLDGGGGQPPVAPGEYVLRVHINPGFTPAEGEPCPVSDPATGLCHNFFEARYDNNVGEVRIVVPDRTGKTGSG